MVCRASLGLSGDRMLTGRVSRGTRAIRTVEDLAPRCRCGRSHGATSAGAGRTAESIRNSQPQTRAERQTTSMRRQPGSMSWSPLPLRSDPLKRIGCAGRRACPAVPARSFCFGRLRDGMCSYRFPGSVITRYVRSRFLRRPRALGAARDMLKRNAGESANIGVHMYMQMMCMLHAHGTRRRP